MKRFHHIFLTIFWIFATPNQTKAAAGDPIQGSTGPGTLWVKRSPSDSNGGFALFSNSSNSISVSTADVSAYAQGSKSFNSTSTGLSLNFSGNTSTSGSAGQEPSATSATILQFEATTPFFLTFDGQTDKQGYGDNVDGLIFLDYRPRDSNGALGATTHIFAYGERQNFPLSPLAPSGQYNGMLPAGYYMFEAISEVDEYFNLIPGSASSSYSGNLVVSIIPEPSAVWMVAISIGTILMWLGRRISLTLFLAAFDHMLQRTAFGRR